MAKVSKAKLLLILAILGVIFLPPFIRYQSLLHKDRMLDARIREKKKEAKRLLAEKKRLETDITYVERTARRTMGVARKGEIVLKETSKK